MLALGVKLSYHSAPFAMWDYYFIDWLHESRACGWSCRGWPAKDSPTLVEQFAQSMPAPSAQRTKVESRSSEARGRSHSCTRLQKDICFRYGRSGRHNGPTACPAINSKCNKWDRVCHFARICQSSKQKPISAIAQVSSVKDWTFNLQCILPSGQVCDIPTKLDTGADVTLISNSEYEDKLADFSLSDAPALFNFDESRIEGIRGIFLTPVTHAGRTANLTVFVVPDHMGSRQAVMLYNNCIWC